MTCENVRCPHYRKPEKRDQIDKIMGVTRKSGGCKYSYCTLRKK